VSERRVARGDSPDELAGGSGVALRGRGEGDLTLLRLADLYSLARFWDDNDWISSPEQSVDGTQ